MTANQMSLVANIDAADADDQNKNETDAPNITSESAAESAEPPIELSTLTTRTQVTEREMDSAVINNYLAEWRKKIEKARPQLAPNDLRHLLKSRKWDAHQAILFGGDINSHESILKKRTDRFN